ncbi:hypothetical protein ACH5RR_009227 [Cinchona calisaya]|uniref:Uncharacterized protein n=1 Tax=Cinchona calisaya TaxID=153742 RepID=A0ABD3AH97_9GENT
MGLLPKIRKTHRFTKAKHELIEKTRGSLTLAQHRMKKHANMGRRDVEFQGVLMDLEPGTMDNIRSSAANNWAKGHYFIYLFIYLK